MRAAALFVVMVSAACSPIALPECSVLCGANDHCALGLTCGQDGYCHGDGKLTGCMALPRDGGTSCVGCVDPSKGPYNYVFVTSQTFVPGSLGGLAGADAQCQQLATAASLSGTFMAWLSTSTTSASSRFLTLSSPPRGWIRRDGRPFADTMAALTAGTISYPARLDENGHDLIGDGSSGDYPHVSVATGTNADGTANATGGDWGAPSAAYTAGDAVSTTLFWTDAKTFDATTGSQPAAHLYCFGIDHANALAPIATTGRTAFITHGTFPSAMFSLSVANADAMCQSEAAGLSGTFLALLGTPGASAASRFDLTKPTWVRLDGVPWLYQASDLAMSAPPTTLNVPPDGSYNSFAEVWTGFSSTTAVALPAQSCNGWSSTASSQNGIAGWDVDSGGFAFDNDSDACGMSENLYCLEK